MKKSPLTLTLLLLTLLPACSAFNQQWKAQSAHPLPPENALEGNWTGTWQSDAGHGQGQLLATITPTNPSNPSNSSPPTQFQAIFKATWGKVVNSEYTVDLTATPTPTALTFTGSKDLGPLAGGLYTYNGSVSQNKFQSTYTSKADHGTFTLTRNP